MTTDRPLTIELINEMIEVIHNESYSQPNLMPMMCPRCNCLMNWIIIHGKPNMDGLPKPTGHKKGCDLWEVLSGGFKSETLSKLQKE